MKIRPSKDYMVALESVTMTDIVLNMFIFFFISFSLIYTFSQAKVSRIDVKLPRASTAVVLNGSDKTILTITRAGEYFINDEKVRKSDLKSRLESVVKSNPDPDLVLKVDALARFDGVVKALDVINELNIRKVSIASVKK